ncbi:MAG: potassium uptake protein, TrkH family, partial [Oscillospiraceae bacterium]|nr:potassium uptake protein, TrkH family [Oscillospiraceae bacterium]
VLITTGALLIGGTILFCLFEWKNPATLGAMTTPQRVVAAFFQSATSRTAGFAAIDQGLLTDSGKAATVFLMLIGGSSGSTAGGLKTVTFVVLLLFLWSRMRGKPSVNVFSRTIPRKHILDAMTLFGVVIILAFFGAVVICATSPVGFTDSLYEAVSALATVGLTTGVTASLSLPAKILIMLYMYFGRVGILTISLGFMRAGGTEDFKYAQTSVQIG